MPVRKPRKAVDHGLGYVTDDPQTTAHVAIKRAVAYRYLTFIPGGQYERAEFVRHGH